MPRQKQHRLSQDQFFQGCQALIELAPQLKAENTSFTAAAIQLTNVVGFKVTVDMLFRFRTSTKVEWDPPAKIARKKSDITARGRRFLAAELVRTQIEFGMEVSDQLYALAGMTRPPATPPHPPVDPKKVAELEKKVVYRPSVDVPVALAGLNGR